MLCGCLVVFGVGGVWCSLRQLHTATGLSVKIIKIRLHEAEQRVLFEGEAVMFPSLLAVVGLGLCSGCSAVGVELGVVSVFVGG